MKISLRQDFIDGVDVLKNVCLDRLFAFCDDALHTCLYGNSFLSETCSGMEPLKNYLGPRQWDNLALWHFREFNELPHIFEKRVARSYEHGSLFAKAK